MENSCVLCGLSSSRGMIHTSCVQKEQYLASSAIISPPLWDGGDIVTRQRDGVYVWVTWLSRLMEGDVQCQWASWFRAHYTAYTKAPSDFQLATWTVDHNQCLDVLCKECGTKSLTYFKENQNNFTVRRGGMTIGGKPDLVVLENDKSYTVYDVKTGQPRSSDVIQVMLYMSFLPYSTSGRYKDKVINGCVVYKGGEKTPIPSQSLDDKFKGQITHFLDILNVPTEPLKVPSFTECFYCDITGADCPARVETQPENKETPELPM